MARMVSMAFWMLGMLLLVSGGGSSLASCATPPRDGAGTRSERGLAASRGPSPPVSPAAHVSRRAVVVGIDHYTTGMTAAQRAGARWQDLGGAVSDAQAMAALLLHEYEFTAAGVTMLLDRAASRRAILDSLERTLVAAAQPGDEVVFFYAGHGSQVPNPASDEPDKRDESLVPADSNQGAEDLRDKELARIFNHILDRGARLTVIFDSCYSGSLARGLPPPGQPRFLPPATRGVVDAAPTGGRPEERGALILSAAQDFELALEVHDEGGAPHGAFSFALVEAMRRSPMGEPAEETFLRARGLLQASDVFQQPVIAGTAERRRAPLFGRGESRRGAGLVVAVQRVEPDGSVLLQGGWAHGLRKGIELEVRDANAGEPVRLRVTRVLGPSSSEAKIVVTRQAGGSRRQLSSGDLATLSAWALADQPGLRVWVPDAAGDWRQALALARELRELAGRSGVTWVADPVESTPTHVAHWDGGWWLTPRGERSRWLGPAPRAADVLRELRGNGKPPSLFVQLPVPSALARALALGAGSANDAVERVRTRDGAHYQLVGRLAGDAVDFAWVRPAAGAADAKTSPLPVRSDWCSGEESRSGEEGHCAATLTDVALRLHKIRSWLAVESPPGAEFPYRLWLVDEAGAAKRAGQLRGGETYRLAARPVGPLGGVTVDPRYLYVFTIDSFGTSTLLFPRDAQGSVENRFPVPGVDASAAGEIRLGAQPAFRVVAPFGTDTFFLLSSDEPVPNPWVVQSTGVRSRGPQGATRLEDLLSQVGSAARGVAPERLPVHWSLERLSFETVGP